MDIISSVIGRVIVSVGIVVVDCIIGIVKVFTIAVVVVSSLSLALLSHVGERRLFGGASVASLASLLSIALSSSLLFGSVSLW